MRDFCVSEVVSFPASPNEEPGLSIRTSRMPADTAVSINPLLGFGAQSSVSALLKEDDLTLIRGSNFFHQMGEPVFSDLMRLCRVRNFGPKRTIFRQADEAKSFFLLLEGWLKVTKLTASGELIVRRVVKAGGTLAEASVFCDGLYPGTAESLTESRLLEIPLAGVIAAMGGARSLAFGMVIGMARQAENTAGQLEEAFRYTAPQRLAAFLIGLFSGTVARTSTRLPYDKCLLALSLGMTPETLSRAFLVLRPLGVRTRNREIFVEDLRTLRCYCRLDD